MRLIRGKTPRLRVLRAVETYENTMGVLLKAVVIRHSGHVFEVKQALKHGEDFIYQQTRENLYKSFEPTPEGALEDKIRFNDSISHLRFVHKKVLARIRGLEYVPS